jgi:hypothetical protein
MATSMNRYEHMVEKTYYIHRRYGVVATFALLYHEEPLAVDVLGSFIRISDHIIPIDENHDFIIFAFTSETNAHKAAQNLLGRLDNYFGSHTCCIALDKFDTDIAPQHVLSRLRQILGESRKHSYARIETESVLDGIF